MTNQITPKRENSISVLFTHSAIFLAMILAWG